jgi:hypothetical protein
MGSFGRKIPFENKIMPPAFGGVYKQVTDFALRSDSKEKSTNAITSILPKKQLKLMMRRRYSYLATRQGQISAKVEQPMSLESLIKKAFADLAKTSISKKSSRPPEGV